MPMEFTIVGGYIKMNKDVFIKEMLIKDSILRQLLNWKGTADFRQKHPMVSEPDPDGIITINFSSTNSVSIGEDPRDFLKGLKARYREKIKGWVSCRGSYELFGGTYFIKMELNSDDDKVEYV